MEQKLQQMRKSSEYIPCGWLMGYDFHLHQCEVWGCTSFDRPACCRPVMPSNMCHQVIWLLLCGMECSDLYIRICPLALLIFLLQIVPPHMFLYVSAEVRAGILVLQRMVVLGVQEGVRWYCRKGLALGGRAGRGRHVCTSKARAAASSAGAAVVVVPPWGLINWLFLATSKVARILLGCYKRPASASAASEDSHITITACKLF